MNRRNFLLASAGAISAAPLRPQTHAPDHNGRHAGILPVPAKMSSLSGSFLLSPDVAILAPRTATPADLFLARCVRDELADWHGLALPLLQTDEPARNSNYIAVGRSDTALVQACLKAIGIATPANGVPESYELHVRPRQAVIAGADFRGALYGWHSLRQLLVSDQSQLAFSAADIQDQPSKPLRGIKLYLPGRANIPFFKRFVRDFLVANKYNTLVMEMNAGMRLDGHPELNAGWREMITDTNYSRLNYPPGSFHGREQNSCHQDTADGGFIEKEEVLELADWVRRHGIELVPELPSYTHSYYLLTRHKDLSDIAGDKWPDTYCPSNPKSYELLFEVYDEYLELLKPKLLHVGHDELFAPIGICPRCKDANIGELYGEDVAHIHKHLQDKGVRMAMWGDMLLETVRGRGLQNKRAPDGWVYKVAGGMAPEQVSRLIPKDVLIFNWFWHKEENLWSEKQAEENEAILDRMGFQQIFGNFGPEIANYETRKDRSSVLGAAPSAWFATNEFNFGKNVVASFLGCASILWSGKTMSAADLITKTQAQMPEIRARFRGMLPPSRTEQVISTLPISQWFNSDSIIANATISVRSTQTTRVQSGSVLFQLADRDGKHFIVVSTNGSAFGSVEGIKVGRDATSLIFLHCSAKSASNQEADRLLWDVIDSADLLGWYEIVYEDEYVETIPIRYGVNIAEWDWGTQKKSRQYCYGADRVTIAEGGTLFAFEWTNPRLGKIIRELRLKATRGFQSADPDYSNHYGPALEPNSVILAAISVVHRRDADVQ